MNYKRAIGIGFVAYLASFAFGIVVALLFGVNFETTAEVPRIVWVVGLIAQIVIGLLFAYWYFSSKKIKKYGVLEGLYLGAVFVAVGFLIDALFIIPSIFISGAPSDILAYYTNPLFWVSILLLFLCTMFVASWFEDLHPSD